MKGHRTTTDPDAPQTEAEEHIGLLRMLIKGADAEIANADDDICRAQANAHAAKERRADAKERKARYEADLQASLGAQR